MPVCLGVTWRSQSEQRVSRAGPTVADEDWAYGDGYYLVSPELLRQAIELRHVRLRCGSRYIERNMLP